MQDPLPFTKAPGSPPPPGGVASTPPDRPPCSLPAAFDDLEVYVLEEEAVRTIDEFVKTWMEVKAGCWGAVCGVGGVLPALGAPPDRWGFVA